MSSLAWSKHNMLIRPPLAHLTGLAYLQAANTTGAFNAFYGLCEASSQATASSFKLRPDSRTFGAMLHSCARAGKPLSHKGLSCISNTHFACHSPAVPE